MTIKEIVAQSLLEDIGSGDFTTLSTVPKEAAGSAKLVVKEVGIISGIEIAQEVFSQVDSSIVFTAYKNEGDKILINDIVFEVKGLSQSILMAERLSLNFMQRMSGIATTTAKYVDKIKHTNTKILDTRKTTPLLRAIEKQAVIAGGGNNHRFGLFDMMMIKDNHIDFAGSVSKAILNAIQYQKANDLNLKIEIEVRNFKELNEVLKVGGINRIMLDNFSPYELEKAVKLINSRYETEASGGITLDTIAKFAETGVDYISVGALTHHIKSIDLSLKAC